MAEIYKQQVEYKTTEAEKLKAPPFKNYVTQGLDAVNQGFKQLDEYMAYTDDKMLAGSMDNVKDEAVAEVDSWQDFNTDGRRKLFESIMEKYDNTLANAPIAAQRRFAVSNPDARNIFALKVNEQILKKANEQVYAEKQRDFSAYADVVASVRDPVDNEKMLRAGLEEVQKNTGDLNVTKVGELVDQSGHDMVLQTIEQAIIEGRDSAAESYLNNPFYLRFLGPTEKNRLRKELVNLRKSQAEDRASGGNYLDIASMLIAGRDAAMRVYGTTAEGRLAVDEDYSKFVRALKNGESMKGLTLNGRPFFDFYSENGLGAIEYWDSLDMTVRQRAADKYEETLSGLYPEYKERQNYLATALNNSLSGYVSKDNDKYIDITNMPNDEYREFVSNVMELRGMRSGLNSNQQKLLDGAITAISARRYGAGKAASVEKNPIQQNMAGFTSGKTFLGGGNLTEAMIRSQQNGEEPISVIDSMLNNSVSGAFPEYAEGFRETGSALDKYGFIIGAGRLAPFVSDFADLLDDGDVKNSHAIAASVGSLMKEMGEVDSRGNLVVPQANSYRFMSYAIPVILSYISVMGNEHDLTSTGIKPDVLNNIKTVDLVYDLQNTYQDRLNDTISVSSDSDISKSGFYEMVLTAIELGKKEGVVNKDVEPDTNTVISLASILKGIAIDAPAIVYTPAKNSGAKKRIDYKTKQMFQFKE